MGSKYSRAQILEAAVEISIEEGIGVLSFGRVARRMGIPDRTVVYYFSRKEELITAVVMHHNERLGSVLSQAFSTPVPHHLELLRTAWPVMTSQEAEVVMRLFLEMIGLSTRGLAPFDALVPQMLEAWVVILMDLLEVPESHKRAEAEAAVALIDGLLLLREMMGHDAAQRAVDVHLSRAPSPR